MKQSSMIPDLYAPTKGFGKKRKRVLQDIKGRVDLKILYNKIIDSPGWPYKISNPKKLVRRDRALIAAIILTGGRINEVLTLRKEQIVEDINHPNFLIIKYFPVSKRKGGNIKENIFMETREEIAIPMVARGLWVDLVPFSKLFMAHVDSVKSGKLFRITDRRCLGIVDATLGVWNHYLRSVCESYLMRIMKDSVVVGKYMRVDPRTLSRYVQTDWRDFDK